MASIAVVRGRDRKRNLERALGLIREEAEGAVAEKGSDRLFIKLNAIDPNFPDACTHPKALEAVLEHFHGSFEEIIVGDNAFLFSRAPEKSIYGGVVGRFKKARFSDLAGEGHERITFKLLNGKETSAWISTLPSSAFTVSLALPKTHDHVVFTACLKNMLGCVIHKRPWVHGLEFYERVFLRRYVRSVKIVNENLAKVIMRARPDLCVLDGFHGMEGDGPIMGERVEMGLAMCGLDGLALDFLAAEVCGFEEVPYLRLCRDAGLLRGEAKVLKEGFEELEEIRMPFKPHYLYPYQLAASEPSIGNIAPIDFRLLRTYLPRFYRIKDKLMEKLKERYREGRDAA